MKSRPIALKLYIFALAASALSMPIQICLNYDIPILNFSEWAGQLTYLNILTMFIMFSAAVTAYKGSKAVYYLTPVMLAIVALNNWWVGYIGTDYSLQETGFAAFGLLVLTALLFEKKTYTVLHDKKAQWWLMAKRRPIRAAVAIHPWVGKSVNGATFDISETGMYVILSSEEELDWEIGARMQMRLNLAGYKNIRCTAKLVRHSTSSGKYPNGVGLEFEDISRMDQSYLRKMLDAH